MNDEIGTVIGPLCPISHISDPGPLEGVLQGQGLKRCSRVVFDGGCGG